MTQQTTQQEEAVDGKPARKEILAWAAYDIANATYGTIVATAVYNAYFVNEIARSVGQGTATVLLTVVICISSMLVVVTAPIVGTICDAKAAKKLMLFLSTGACVAATALLALVRPGHIWLAMALFIFANFAFGTGEDLIAAFLPELASKDDMGRISALGWGAGYVGGLFALGACFWYMSWAKVHGLGVTDYVPYVMFGVALLYALLSLPTFMILRERAKPEPMKPGHGYIEAGFRRRKETWTHTRHYRDLFAFLLALLVYSCGTTTVVHLAAVYAQAVAHFTAADSVAMILVVNVTAATGAFFFGFIQDKLGSVKTLAITLLIWTVAILFAACSTTKPQIWIAANLVGIAMGSTGSAGRALVGQFAPVGRSAEFLGLWGVAVKLATALGAISFGFVTVLTHNNLRVALFSTIGFFIVGIFLLRSVNEERGRLAAHSDVNLEF
jgi:MFS transporter, UMF1 family